MSAKDKWDAEVILRSVSAESAGKQSKTSKQTKQGGATNAMDKVAAALRAKGFEILSATPRSISIRAPKDVFSKNLPVSDDAAPDDALMVPSEIRDHVEGIYLQKPPTYF